ncbi:MAG: hypothetical protein H0S80_04080 [Desulfovibrionaceae bacterium]|nr:hypothetical protein [Desulfovibrionaceae bacterium]
MGKVRTRLKDKRLVGVNALAEYIDSTPGSVRVMMCRGTLPFPWIKHGRKVLFDLADVDGWIESLPRYEATSPEAA